MVVICDFIPATSNENEVTGVKMKKVICIGDLHIGWKNADYDAIHRMLDRIEENKDEIDVLVLNGDIVDLIRCRYKDIRKNEIYNDAFEHLQKVTNMIRTEYCIGNHCLLAPEIIGKDLNVEYHESFIHDNIIFMHGHQFCKIQMKCVLAFIIKHLNFIGKRFDYGSAYISAALHKKIYEFARANFYEFVVVSHTHVPYIFRNVIYCGDMTQNPSYIEISENKIKIKKI